ncbi:MAG: hypothetical protein ACRDH6_03710 [Actinomycetota bacterium]
MFRFLRRFQPRNVVLAILYWVVLTIVALTAIFTIFFFIDDYLPGAGMF